MDLLLLALLLTGGLSIVVYTLRTGISPMPTSGKVRRHLLSQLPAEAEGTVLELGAGWGTLAFALADRCPRARVVAFELSPLPYAFCWLRQRLAPRANLRLVRQDFFRASFAGASVVVCYLFPGAMVRLASKLSEELPPGALILSHTFALRGWRPLRTLVVDDLYRTPIYVYEVPARGTGHRATGSEHGDDRLSAPATDELARVVEGEAMGFEVSLGEFLPTCAIRDEWLELGILLADERPQ